jgi:hypothetical protein
MASSLGSGPIKIASLANFRRARPAVGTEGAPWFTPGQGSRHGWLTTVVTAATAGVWSSGERWAGHDGGPKAVPRTAVGAGAAADTGERHAAQQVSRSRFGGSADRADR